MESASRGHVQVEPEVADAESAVIKDDNPVLREETKGEDDQPTALAKEA